MVALVEIRVLGSLHVTVDGVPLDALHNAPRLTALLGYLVTHRDQPVERSRLAGLFWPDRPEHQARRTLNSHLYRLRRLAGGRLTSALFSRPNTLRWRLPPDGWLDLDHFERSVATPAQLEYAVALYRGPLLANLDAPWLAPPRARLEQRLIARLRRLATYYEQLGERARLAAVEQRLAAMEG